MKKIDHKILELYGTHVYYCTVLCRYVPVGLLECVPQKINERPQPYYGRDDMETLMASNNCQDWIKIR